jgi:hypothetical protein
MVSIIATLFMLLSITRENRAANPRQGKEDIVSAVMARFRLIRSGNYREFLKSIRPPRLSVQMKSLALTYLPPEGEVNPDASSVAVLEKLLPILAYHERESIMEIKLIQASPAAVAVYARCVLIISEQTLRLLSVSELQALAAHELGHEYVWEAYESALERRDSRSIRELELWCDGVAVLTLLDLRIDPHSLATGILKINRYNSRFGVPVNAGDYPPDSLRNNFLRTLLAITNKPGSLP